MLFWSVYLSCMSARKLNSEVYTVCKGPVDVPDCWHLSSVKCLPGALLQKSSLLVKAKIKNS